MATLLLRKLLRALATLLGTTLIVFLLMHAVPGSPWDNYVKTQRPSLGPSASPGPERELIRRFGLDQPLWRQFTRYVFGDVDEAGVFFCGALCGNLGPSIAHRGPSVTQVLFAVPEERGPLDSRFGYSLRLVAFASAGAIGLGLALGLLSAARPGSPVSRTISIGLAALSSVPGFVLGLVAILVLAVGLRATTVLPDWNKPGNWIAPVLVLAAGPMAGIARITHAALTDTLAEDFVRTARAKGMPWRRVMRVHVLRPALAPILAAAGPVVVEMLAGSFIIENLYGFPGFGRSYFDAMLALDYPMILGLTLIYATGMLIANLTAGVLSEAYDPRLRAAVAGGRSA